MTIQSFFSISQSYRAGANNYETLNSEYKSLKKQYQELSKKEKEKSKLLDKSNREVFEKSQRITKLDKKAEDKQTKEGRGQELGTILLHLLAKKPFRINISPISQENYTR